MVVQVIVTGLLTGTALELRLGGRAQTHPMALNRFMAMVENVAGLVDECVLAMARSSVARRIDRRGRSFSSSIERVAHDAPPIAIAALQGMHVSLAGPPQPPRAKSTANLWGEIVAHWFRY